MKRAKKTKRNMPQKISAEDMATIESLYRIKPQYVNGIYLTPIIQAKSTMVRMTFYELNVSLMKQVPVCAVALTIEDLQSNYNVMTEFLQKMRTMGRIA